MIAGMDDISIDVGRLSTRAHRVTFTWLDSRGVASDSAWEPQLRLIRASPPPSPSAPAVLYVHGATFAPTMAIGWPMGGPSDGRTWMGQLRAAGFDVWGLDFAGFGGSERYPAMDQPATSAPPLLRAADAAAQIERALRYIRAMTGVSRVHLLAHSWGTLPACRVAAQWPERIASVVLFGAILGREGRGESSPATGWPAWRLVTVEEQWERFNEDVPPDQEPLMTRADFDAWASAWLASDPLSRGRRPPAVQVPCGPIADISAAWNGDLPYDPAAVRAPTLLVRGAWDHLCTDADARVFVNTFIGGALRRDVKLPCGTHLMHLETGRSRLWQAVNDFMQEVSCGR